MCPITYNQVSMPAFMYGTAWKKDSTAHLVEQAVAAGFTAIDTANQIIHYDEAKVGDALLALQKKGVKREDLFLQTKFTSVNGQDHRTPYDAKAKLTEQVKQSFESSLKHLHTDYLDSYVLHGPYYRRGLAAEDWEIWRAIEAQFKAGGTKMIGISNVSIGQLAELFKNAETKPMVVQNRCYATMGWDKEVRDFCRKENIIYQGFSLLTANSNVLASPPVRSIAERLGKTPAQVIFSFSVQIGMLPLTGTTNLKHMKDDLDALNLQLSTDELQMIETIAM